MTFEPGKIVIASDGMMGGEATIIAGPIQQLTTDYALYHIRFNDDGAEFLAHAEDLEEVEP